MQFYIFDCVTPSQVQFRDTSRDLLDKGYLFSHVGTRGESRTLLGTFARFFARTRSCSVEEPNSL